MLFASLHLADSPSLYAEENVPTFSDPQLGWISQFYCNQQKAELINEISSAFSITEFRERYLTEW